MLILTLPMPFVASAPAWVPTDVAGLALWCKPESLAALANNDPVASWADSSGNARHLVQGTLAKKPTYLAAGGPNSMPAVSFDGSDDWLGVAFDIAVPVTMFVVLKQVTWTSGDRIMDGYTTTTMRLMQTCTTPGLRVCGSSTTGLTVNSVALDTWCLLKTLWNGASSSAAYNGAADTTGSIATGTPTGISLGATGAGGSAGNIVVSELLVYAAALSAPDQTSVKNYLNARYALW